MYLQVMGQKGIGFVVDSGTQVSVMPRSVLPDGFDLAAQSTRVVLRAAFTEKVVGFLTDVKVSLCNKDLRYNPVLLSVAITDVVQDKKALIRPEDFVLLRADVVGPEFSDQYITGTRLLVDPGRSEEVDAQECLALAMEYSVREISTARQNAGAVNYQRDLCSMVDFADQSAADSFQAEQVQDESLASVWKEVKSKKSKTAYFIDDKGFLQHQKRFGPNVLNHLVLPEIKRKSVMSVAHEGTWGNHLGRAKTQRRLELQFSWPSLTADVKQYVKTCTSCQLHARKTKKDRIPIQLVKTPICFGDMFCADLIGPLQPESSAGHKYVLCLVDAATAWPELAPLKSLSAKELCEQLVLIWTRTGVPKILTTDNATNFTSQLSEEL